MSKSKSRTPKKHARAKSRRASFSAKREKAHYAQGKDFARTIAGTLAELDDTPGEEFMRA